MDLKWARRKTGQEMAVVSQDLEIRLIVTPLPSGDWGWYCVGTRLCGVRDTRDEARAAAQEAVMKGIHKLIEKAAA